MEIKLKENGEKYNIVLLGGSNSVMVNGLQKGLRQENVNLTNLALGASNSLQKLYSLIRSKNQEALKQADFIVIETNINDTMMLEDFNASENVFVRNFTWLCSQLYRSQKKIIFIILSFWLKKHRKTLIVDNLIREKANKYGFNVIDMQEHYKKLDVYRFYYANDLSHQLQSIMCEMGKNIARNLIVFRHTKTNVISDKIPKFKLFHFDGDRDGAICVNTQYSEVMYRLNEGSQLHFPRNLVGYKLIGFMSWNKDEQDQCCASIKFINSDKKIVKSTREPWLLIHDINNDFTIDCDSFICINQDSNITEGSFKISISDNPKRTLDYINLGDFIFAKDGEWDYDIPNDKEIVVVDEDYDFSCLIPDVQLYKNIIEEYCLRMNMRSNTKATIKRVLLDVREILIRVASKLQKSCKKRMNKYLGTKYEP